MSDLINREVTIEEALDFAQFILDSVDNLELIKMRDSKNKGDSDE